MRPRHPPGRPLPRRWLMTDERMGAALLPAIARLPRGSGIVFRHYSLRPAERRALLAQVKRAARGRHVIIVARPGPGLRADGVHNGRGCGLSTRAAHSHADLIAAARAGTHLVFLSPVFETRSHRDARPLGRIGFHQLVRRTHLPVIALGGMDERRARTLRCYGWAAIDAWLVPDRLKGKRYALPRQT